MSSKLDYLKRYMSAEDGGSGGKSKKKIKRKKVKGMVIVDEDISARSAALSDGSDQDIPVAEEVIEPKPASPAVRHWKALGGDDDDSDRHQECTNRTNSDTSPPRTRVHSASDSSPPRRHKSNPIDSSPPRRHKSNPIDSSPPRRHKSNPIDSSPPRRHKSNPIDSSPPRRHKSNPIDSSPPRRHKSNPIDSSPPRRHKSNPIDSSPPRRRKSKPVDSSPPQQQIQQRQMELGKGLVQKQQADVKIDDMLHEMTKPLARYRDDSDLDEMLRNEDREGDPMLAFLQKKKKKKLDPAKPERPIWKGAFPANRFNIRPGYRWDGVDRSNGFEKKFFSMQASRKATAHEAYQWSVEDM